jgi:F0F1-type ATP synthase assembly protein I
MTPNNRKAMAMAFAMGGELTASLLVGVAIGYYGGRYFHFAEWGAVIGSFVGFSAWVWRIVASKKYLQ